MSTSSPGRVVEVADAGRYLAKDRGFLTVSGRGAELGRVALDDITAVVATSPATTISCALLADLAARGIPFVLCGRNYAPAGMLWPVAGHHAQQRRIETQAEAGKPLKKRLWALVVAAKIRAQAAALQAAGRETAGLAFLARQVKSGDPENLEAQAARRYWPLLMGSEFRRDAAADGANALLNYGYAVLRGSTARAIVAAGLHPGMGIFHRHPHNAMPLADDLMEPFRPLVDSLVVNLLREGQPEVTPGTKRRLAGVLHADQETQAGTTPLESCIYRLAASLAESFLNGKACLAFPLRPGASVGVEDATAS